MGVRSADDKRLKNWELTQYEDGATRSKIDVGWHLSWEREERRRRERRRPETRFFKQPI